MEEELRACGWEHLPAEGMIAHLGGLWRRMDNGQAEIGFIARAFHLNRNGVVHGGMMMTVVDRAFGIAARDEAGVETSATISLSHQFLTPLQAGRFASVIPRVVRTTSRLAFLEGTLMSEGVPILQAQGVWRLIRTP